MKISLSFEILLSFEDCLSFHRAVALPLSFEQFLQLIFPMKIAEIDKFDLKFCIIESIKRNIAKYLTVAKESFLRKN